jgi:hypothetical protein
MASAATIVKSIRPVAGDSNKTERLADAIGPRRLTYREFETVQHSSGDPAGALRNGCRLYGSARLSAEKPTMRKLS